MANKKSRLSIDDGLVGDWKLLVALIWIGSMYIDGVGRSICYVNTVSDRLGLRIDITTAGIVSIISNIKGVKLVGVGIRSAHLGNLSRDLCSYRSDIGAA